MTGPQKHIIQTPNRKGMLQTIKLRFTNCEFLLNPQLGCRMCNSGAKMKVSSRQLFHIILVIMIASWEGPHRIHNLGSVEGELPFFTILEQMFLTFSQQALWLSQIQETCGRVDETCCPFFSRQCFNFWFFMFIPIPGRWTHSDEHIFQMGWWKTTNQFFTCLIKEFVSLDRVIFDLNLGPAVSCRRYQPLALMSGATQRFGCFRGP